MVKLYPLIVLEKRLKNQLHLFPDKEVYVLTFFSSRIFLI